MRRIARQRRIYVATGELARMHDTANVELQSAHLSTFEFQRRYVVLLAHGQRRLCGGCRPVDETNEGRYPFLIRQGGTGRRHQRNGNRRKHYSQNDGQNAGHAFIVRESLASVAYVSIWERGSVPKLWR